MAINFLKSLNSELGMDLAEHSATFFDEEVSNTRPAVSGSFGAILAGMIQRVSYDKGAKDLHKILMKEDVREYDIEDIFTRSPQTVNGMVNRGRHFLPSIYPGKQREASNAIAEHSNISKDTSAKMMKVCSPLMLNGLAKHVQENNLDANGLKSFLNGMKDEVKSTVPSNFFDKTELSSFGWTKKAEVKEEPKQKKVKKVKEKVIKKPVVAEPIEEVSKAGGMGFLKWLLPLLVFIGLIWLLIMKGCGGTVDKPIVKNIPLPKVETKAVTAPIKNIFGSVNEAAKTALGNISFAAGSVGDQMIKYIDGGASGDARFRFKNLNFASGSANIDGSTGVEVDNVAAVLKAYTDVKVTIEGFTDSRGNPDSNLTLSQQRADAVKNRLVAAGISADRLMTEGYGVADPIADNETAEGRAQNRRIEMVVVK